jgi:hypothetical protein
MKEKEIKVEGQKQRVILYVEKDDESYAPVESSSYLSENYLDDWLGKRQQLEAGLRQKLEKGEISPVYYYMVYQDIGPGDLAKRIGISQRKLRKHFRPEVFAKLDEKILAKYAMVFGINVEDLRLKIED